MHSAGQPVFLPARSGPGRAGSFISPGAPACLLPGSGRVQVPCRSWHLARPFPRPFPPMKLSFSALCALSLAALSSQALAAPPIVQGTARFLVLDAQDAPLMGTTVSGVCEANLGSFWNRETLVSRWSCTTDADGVCTAPVTTLAQPDGKPAPAEAPNPAPSPRRAPARRAAAITRSFPRAWPPATPC